MSNSKTNAMLIPSCTRGLESSNTNSRDLKRGPDTSTIPYFDANKKNLTTSGALVVQHTELWFGVNHSRQNKSQMTILTLLILLTPVIVVTDLQTMQSVLRNQFGIYRRSD